eukprot:gnl/Chilomastix_cuspidata/1816.p1 GENE.gnl/Chilomastix_cuspidata/1816~~gnl/Chilomastix_cuspidata/1816.p1  ORF type:complete len:359 (-),score=117.15 gnl/Chilomastix_cuspidata/1816:101-1177(-)
MDPLARARLRHAVERAARYGFAHTQEREEAIRLLLAATPNEFFVSAVCKKDRRLLPPNVLHVLKADAARSFHFLPAGDIQERWQHTLHTFLIDFFEAHPSTNYLQGFNSVVSAALFAVPHDRVVATRVVELLAGAHLRPWGECDIESALELLALVPELAARVSPRLAYAFTANELPPSCFVGAASTLCLHNVSNARCTLRLFDFALFGGPFAPLYVLVACAGLRLPRLERALAAGADRHFSAVNRFFQNAMAELGGAAPRFFDTACRAAAQLMRAVPPEALAVARAFERRYPALQFPVGALPAPRTRPDPVAARALRKAVPGLLVDLKRVRRPDAALVVSYSVSFAIGAAILMSFFCV